MLDTSHRGWVSFSQFERAMAYLFGTDARGVSISPMSSVYRRPNMAPAAARPSPIVVNASAGLMSAAHHTVSPTSSRVAAPRRSGIVQNGAYSLAIFREAIAGVEASSAPTANRDDDDTSDEESDEGEEESSPDADAVRLAGLEARLNGIGGALLKPHFTIEAAINECKTVNARSPSHQLADGRIVPSSPSRRGASPFHRLRRKSNFSSQLDEFWSGFEEGEFDDILSESDDDTPAFTIDYGKKKGGRRQRQQGGGKGQGGKRGRRGRGGGTKSRVDSGRSGNENSVSPRTRAGVAGMRKITEISARMVRWKRRYKLAEQRGDAVDSKRSSAAFRKLKQAKKQLTARLGGDSFGVFGVSKKLPAARGGAKLVKQQNEKLAAIKRQMLAAKREHGERLAMGDKEGVHKSALRYKALRTRKRALEASMKS
tara:strand:- start:1375 stop:2658 length:1284 start_codon:yes stop_codon:yes gene_type:complete